MLVVIIVAIFIVINFAMQKLELEPIDFTEDNLYTLTEESKEKVSSEYFLAGEDKMSLNHLVTGIMSVSNFEFKYPEIEKSSDKYEIASEIAGLRVEMDDEGYDSEEETKASKFKISYFIDLNENGVEDPGERMGYKSARKYGYYIVGTLMSYFVPNYDYSVTPANPTDESWGYSGYFGYVDEIYGAMVDFYEDTGERVGDNDDTTGRNTY